MPKKYQPSVHDVLDNLYPNQDARKWGISFGDGGVDFTRTPENEDGVWEYISFTMLNRIGDELKAEDSARQHAVHMSHCNDGENEGTCKYGDDDCPAMVDYVDPELARVQELTAKDEEIAELRAALEGLLEGVYGDGYVLPAGPRATQRARRVLAATKGPKA
jgi:hypothetical protein